MTLIIRQDVIRGWEFIIVSYYQARVKVATATLTNDTNWSLKKAVTHKWKCVPDCLHKKSTRYTNRSLSEQIYCFIVLLNSIAISFGYIDSSNCNLTYSVYYLLYSPKRTLFYIYSVTLYHSINRNVFPLNI